MLFLKCPPFSSHSNPTHLLRLVPVPTSQVRFLYSKTQRSFPRILELFTRELRSQGQTPSFYRKLSPKDNLAWSEWESHTVKCWWIWNCHWAEWRLAMLLLLSLPSYIATASVPCRLSSGQTWEKRWERDWAGPPRLLPEIFARNVRKCVLFHCCS